MLRLIYVMVVIATCNISTVESFNCRRDVNSTSVCGDNSMTGNVVYLSGVKMIDNTTQCSCSLSTETPTNVTINTGQIPHGCGYKFQFLYMTTSWEYTCAQNYVPIISIKNDDSVEINLLQDHLTAARIFEVCLRIQAETLLTLACGKSRWSTSSYKTDIETSVTENITPSGNESNQPTTPTSGNQPNQSTYPTSKNDNPVTSIIGGSVGGFILLVIIIVVIVCVVRKRKREVIYESTNDAQNDPHTYSCFSEQRPGEITHQPKATKETLRMDNCIDNNTPTYVNQQLEYPQNDARSDYVVGDYVNVEKAEE